MPAAAPSSPDSNCSLPAIFVAFWLVLVVLVLVIDVLVTPLADEPPVPEAAGVLRANTAEILLACTASIFAPHGLAVPAVPSCGHPVQLATMPKCPAKVEQLRVKSGEAPPSGPILEPSLLAYRENNKLLAKMLMRLWTSTVKPILADHLHLSPCKNIKSLPRIWWLCVGSMSFFPIHAAGNHQPGSVENILHYAISSYVPTIKALAYSQEQPFLLLQKTTKKLLLATNCKLPGVIEETKVLHEIASMAATSSPSTTVIIKKKPAPQQFSPSFALTTQFNLLATA
jgi:hypothetical protein